MKNLESQEQQALFQWAKLNENIYPDLKLLFSIPNGGKRHIVTAVRMKAEGQKSGVPDVFLPVPKCGYHGLFVELKVGKNKTSANQDYWLSVLSEKNYKAKVCYGWESAKDAILEYLRL
jgi:hypothetical protein